MAKVTRGQRLGRRVTDALETKRVNAIRKSAETRRRDERMIAHLRNDPFPYTANVMSWLSRKLDKPSSRITEQDVKQFLAS
jgi:hypothetical protein